MQLYALSALSALSVFAPFVLFVPLHGPVPALARQQRAIASPAMPVVNCGRDYTEIRNPNRVLVLRPASCALQHLPSRRSRSCSVAIAAVFPYTHPWYGCAEQAPCPCSNIP